MRPTHSRDHGDPCARRIEAAERWEDRLVHGGAVGRLGARVGLAVIDRREAHRVDNPTPTPPPGAPAVAVAALAQPRPPAGDAIPCIPLATVVDLRPVTSLTDVDAIGMSAARRLPLPAAVNDEALWQAWATGMEDADAQLARLDADLDRPARLVGRRHPARQTD